MGEKPRVFDIWFLYYLTYSVYRLVYFRQSGRGLETLFYALQKQDFYPRELDSFEFQSGVC